MWLKLDKSIFEHNDDVYLCYIYVRDKNTRVHRHHEIDYFDLLESDIITYSNLGKVFITGDFNSRTGPQTDLHTDILHPDRYIHSGQDDTYCHDIPIRFNCDKVTDNYGKRLLELCKSTGVLIANGRIGTDKSVGQYTFVCERGNSTLDYMLIKFADIDQINHFDVRQPCELSDHCALDIGLKVKLNTQTHLNTNEYNSDPHKRLIWSDEKIVTFKQELSNSERYYKNLEESLDGHIDGDTLQNITSEFSNNLYETAFNHFGKTFKTQRNAQWTVKNKK